MRKTRSENKLLVAAREYADRYGWSIVPVEQKAAFKKWKRFQKDPPSSKQLGGMFLLQTSDRFRRCYGDCEQSLTGPRFRPS